MRRLRVIHPFIYPQPKLTRTHPVAISCVVCVRCTRNHFPPHYSENISETNLPAELIPQFTTVEYELQTPPCGPPAFLFVVDTCVDEDELNHLRDSLLQTLNLLPVTHSLT